MLQSNKSRLFHMVDDCGKCPFSTAAALPTIEAPPPR